MWQLRPDTDTCPGTDTCHRLRRIGPHDQFPAPCSVLRALDVRACGRLRSRRRRTRRERPGPGGRVATPVPGPPRLDQVEAVEEPGDLRDAPHVVRHGATRVVGLRRGDHALAGGGAVADHQMTARRQARHQPAHQVAGLVVVGDMAERVEDHQGDRPGEVEGVGRGFEDALGGVQVGVEVDGPALGCAAEQGVRVGQHDGVVVDVDDPGVRGGALRDLVGVVGGRQAGADVEELAYALLVGQVADGASQEVPARDGHVDEPGKIPLIWSPISRSTS